jgi:hypothetical protein
MHLTSRVPANQKFAGVLYLHCISANRITEPFTKGLFGRYWGVDLGRNVCVTTTHWDRVDKQVGAQREKEIRENYCATGTPMARFLHTRESAWDVVETLLQADTAGVDKERSLLATE